jgi:hypothetical protein
MLYDTSQNRPPAMTDRTQEKETNDGLVPTHFFPFSDFKGESSRAHHNTMQNGGREKRRKKQSGTETSKRSQSSAQPILELPLVC